MSDSSRRRGLTVVAALGLILWLLLALPGIVHAQSPDLQVTSLTNPPATATIGTAFSITDTTTNTGSASAKVSTTRYRLSVDATITNTDPLLTGSRDVPLLAAGEASTGTVTVAIASTIGPGSYYLAACADDKKVITESNETNNCLVSATTIQVVQPDLTVTALTEPPARAAIGGTFAVTDTTTNLGSGPAAASETRYRLSLNATIADNDPLLTGTRAIPELSAGADSTGTVTVTIPTSLAAGTYFLGACADDTKVVPAEISETNNCRASATTVIISSAATITSLSPTSGPPGTAVTITGANFGESQGSSVVSFNGIAASVASWSASAIIATVPSGTGTGLVVVTVGGVASNGITFTVTGIPTTITYIYDALGRLRAAVGAFEAAIYTYDAVGNLLSIGRQDTSTTSIIEFPETGAAGAAITIHGIGFSSTPAGNTVSFNGVLGTVVSATTTKLVVTVPVGAASGPLTVTTANGSATTATPFTTGGPAAAPTITSFTPSIGAPGTAVTIAGTNFDPPPGTTHVRFNVGRGLVNSITQTAISATVPPGASGRVSVTTVAGKGVSADDFFIPPPPYAAADVEVTGRTSLDGAGKAVSIETPGRIALFVFDAAVGQVVSALASNATFNGSRLVIIKPDGAELGDDRLAESPTGNSNFVEPRSIPVSGTYTLMLDGHAFPAGIDSGQPTSGQATLNAYSVIDVTGEITQNGPAVPVTLSTPGQRARLTFAGVAGQQVSARATNSTIGRTRLSIFGPDGTEVAGNSFSVATGFIDTRTLPATGTYTLVLDPSLSNTGQATLALYGVADVTGTITPNGPTVTVTLGTPGQRARLTFDGTANQQVSAQVSASTITGSSRVSVLKPDGTELLANSFSGTSGFLDPATLPANGTYTLMLDPTSANTGQATLALFAVTDVTGTIAADGQPVSVALNTPGQRALLTFSGTAGQQVTAQVTSSTIAASRVSIVKPDGTELTGNTFSGSTGFLDLQVLPLTGTYTVLLDPTGANTGQAAVTLYGVTDVEGMITADGQPVTVTLTTSGQRGRLTFSGSSGQQVISQVTGSNVPGSSKVSILKPDGSELAFNTFSGTTALLDLQVLPSNGTYTLVFDPVGAGTGQATLALFTVTDVTGTITAGGASVNVTLTTLGQRARLLFDAPTGQQVSAQATNSTVANARVSILKPDGVTEVGGNTFSGTSGFLEPQTLVDGGVYTLMFDPTGTNTGEATLILYAVTDVTGPITVNGATVAVTLATPGQRARLTFDGVANQQIGAQVTGSTITGSSRMSILNPDGTELAGNSFSGAGASIGTQTLPVAGTYTLMLDPTITNTGQATLRLTSP